MVKDELIKDIIPLLTEKDKLKLFNVALKQFTAEALYLKLKEMQKKRIAFFKG